jgi:UDP-3-O-[3-hydroxymyristoyl] N-acetylglucosamine deacetylase/3-hydroxyacyl-[acyl-carrier-protein] dehydratase
LVKKLREQYEKKQITTRYQKKAPGDFLLDINAILEIMPHRYPFLLVDRVLDIQPRKKVVAIKNVTMNEPFFSGHFPGHPIMPGVLIVEAMAQAGGILLLNTVDDPEDKLVYFMGIDGVRFRKPVMPGDQIRFELEMTQFRRGTCKMQGKAYVEGDLVTEANLMATIVDK